MVLLLLLEVVGASPVQSQELTPAEYARDELLVKFRPGVDPVAVATRYGASILRVIPGIDVYLLAVPGGGANDVVAALSADPDVLFAEINGTMTVPERPIVPSPDCP